MHPPARTQPPRTRVRWLARRPPETLPVPRRPHQQPTPTPRYTSTPRWGLRQTIEPETAPALTRTESLAAQAPFALRLTTVVIALAAVAQGFAYLLLVINRSGLVPGWLALVATVGVFALGWLAVIATVGAVVALACWLQTARARAYAAVGTREPRPRWQLWVYCLIPVVNLVAAPVLVLELLRAQNRAADVHTDRRAQFIRMWWVGWLVTTIVTVGCVAYARASGGLQHHADAMLYTALSYVISAVMMAATAWIVDRVDDGSRGRVPEKEKRWVAA